MRHVEKIVKLNFNNVIHKTCIMKQQGFIRRWAVNVSRIAIFKVTAFPVNNDLFMRYSEEQKRQCRNFVSLSLL